jgi:hypothetical protein
MSNVKCNGQQLSFENLVDMSRQTKHKEIKFYVALLCDRFYILAVNTFVKKRIQFLHFMCFLYKTNIRTP